MANIKAVAGATLSVNGVSYPVPKDTEVNIREGTNSNLTTTGFDQNGDGTATPLYSINSGMIEGMVVSLTTDERQDEFNALFESDSHQVVFSSGGKDWSCTAILVSPSEDGPPSVSSVNRKCEAFNIKSVSGKILRS